MNWRDSIPQSAVRKECRCPVQAPRTMTPVVLWPKSLEVVYWQVESEPCEESLISFLLHAHESDLLKEEQALAVSDPGTQQHPPLLPLHSLPNYAPDELAERLCSLQEDEEEEDDSSSSSESSSSEEEEEEVASTLGPLSSTASPPPECPAAPPECSSGTDRLLAFVGDISISVLRV